MKYLIIILLCCSSVIVKSQTMSIDTTMARGKWTKTTFFKEIGMEGNVELYRVTSDNDTIISNPKALVIYLDRARRTSELQISHLQKQVYQSQEENRRLRAALKAMDANHKLFMKNMQNLLLKLKSQ